MAEQTPGQLLKSYPVYALRGIRIGLLAFVATLVVVVVVKLARTGQADDVQGSPRAPDLMFVLMMAVLTAGSAPFGEAPGDHVGIFRFVTAKMSRLLRPVVWPRRELRNG
jgi:hypothetical protein